MRAGLQIKFALIDTKTLGALKHYKNTFLRYFVENIIKVLCLKVAGDLRSGLSALRNIFRV